MTLPILWFRGKYNFLSNFYPCFIHYKKFTYPSVEHAYQAEKTYLPSEFIAIATANTAADAKTLGGKVKLREDWEDVKRQVMYEIVKAKFKQNPTLMEQLKATGDVYIEEGNTWHDNYWGRCYCSRCEDKPKENYLGKILMVIRNEA